MTDKKGIQEQFDDTDERLDEAKYEKLREQIDKIHERLDEQYTLIEQRVDSQEELIANLMMAYAELASSTETIIQEMMSPRAEAEKQEFRRSLNERHASMLQMIREVANDVENRGPANSAESILTMAAKQQTATANSERDNAPGDEG